MKNRFVNDAARVVIFALLALCLHVNFVGAQVLFPAPGYDVASQPNNLAVADFDGDGKPDLVTSSTYGVNMVCVLRNNGDGTYAPPVTYTIGAGSSALAAADVDGDGKPDILSISNTSPAYVNVLHNNGSGTFAAEVDYALAADYVTSLAVADINGDGKPDLVLAHYGALGVMLNKGNGVFAAETLFYGNFAPGSHVAIALADVNGDGRPDLIVANDAYQPTISVMLNIGGGRFGANTDYSVSTTPIALSVGDLNGDGKPDIAAAYHVSYPAQENYVLILKNEGSGFFGYAANYAVTAWPSSMTIADLNGDGKGDIITAGGQYQNPGTITVLRNQGGFSFAAADYAFGNAPSSVATADVDGDGKLDVIVANANANNVGILRGKGDGSFNIRTDYRAPSPSALAVADVNGDGVPDVITTSSYSNSVSVLLNNGDGILGAQTIYGTGASYAVGASPDAVAVADLDGDGKPEIVTANAGSSTVSVLRNNGDGTFAAKVDYGVGGQPTGVVIADFDGDGRPDILTVGSNPTVISLLHNKGDGTFAPSVDSSVAGYLYRVVTADFNGDGKPDIASLVGSGVSVFLNNGSGGFLSPTNYVAGDGPQSLAVGDLNGDGKPDLITVNYGLYDFNSGTYSGGNSVSVLLNKGDGTFSPKTDYPVGIKPRCVVAADVNGDGKADILTGNDADTVSILPGNGDGTFGAKTDYFTGDIPIAVAVADINADGKPDVITANSSASSVSLLLNQTGPARASLSGVVALQDLAYVPNDTRFQNVTFVFRPVGGGAPIVQQRRLLVSSAFLLANVPVGKFTLWIKSDLYLAVAVPLDTTGGNVSDLTVSLPCGDANNDNSVDMSDFGILVGAYGSDASISGSGYDATADFNGDGLVDSADFGLLVNNYGSVGAL